MKSDENLRIANSNTGELSFSGDKRLFIRFEEFTLDLQRRVLYRGDERLHLTPKPLETLIYLLENPGRTVRKKELLDVVWKDSYVSEDTLVQTIREIRRVLGDQVENPRFIQTVPREGYRVVTGVRLEGPALESTTVHSRIPSEVLPDSFQVPPVATKPGFRVSPWFYVPAVMSLFFVFWFLGKHSEPGEPSAGRLVAPMPMLKPHTVGMYSAVKPMASPDGKHLLCVAMRNDQAQTMDLCMTPLEGNNVLQVTDGANPSGDMPVFTADGSHVVFSRYRSGEDGSTFPDLWMVPTFGGPAKLFLRQARGAGFSPDGQWVAYTHLTSEKAALLMSPANRLSEQRELGETGFNPRWSPDGKWIAFTTSDPEGGAGHLWITSASKSQRRQLTQELSQIYGLTWAADSRSIIFSSGRRGIYHLYRLFLADSSILPLTAGVGDYFSPSVTPDGKTLLFCHTQNTRDLVLLNRLTRGKVNQLTHDESHLWPRLSPSATRVASVSRRPDCYECLYVTDLDSGKSTQLSTQSVFHPSWLDDENVAYLQQNASPDKTIVGVANVSTGVSSVWTQFSGEASFLAVHPDRKQVAVVLKPPRGPTKIVLRHLDQAGEDDQILAEGAEYHQLRWLPNGKSLSWSGPEVSASPESSGIWVLDLGQKVPHQLSRDGYGPVWSSDGQVVYFSRFPRIRGQAGLWSLNLERNQLNKVCSWYLVYHHDIVGERLVYALVSNLSQIYSMALQ